MARSLLKETLEFSVEGTGTMLVIKDSKGQAVPWRGAYPVLRVLGQRIRLQVTEKGRCDVVVGELICGSIMKTSDGWVVNVAGEAGGRGFTDVRQAVSLHLSLVQIDKKGPVPVYVWPDGSRHDAY
jgi:hypothetical protein